MERLVSVSERPPLVFPVSVRVEVEGHGQHEGDADEARGGQHHAAQRGIWRLGGQLSVIFRVSQHSVSQTTPEQEM